MKKLVAMFLALTMLVSVACVAMAAGTYPDGTVTFICPWDAGGSSDLITRKIADMFAQKTGAKTAVENQGGAGGTVATSAFANAAADGYSICQEAIGVFTLQPFTREVSYSIDDFKPVAMLSVEPILLLVPTSSGITDLKGLLDKGSLLYGYSGAGSLMELSQKKLFADAGVDAVGIPYDGSSPTLTALLGGFVDCAVSHPGEALPYLESGDLTAIGIFGAERDNREAFSGIATIKEQGYDVCMSVWKFMIVPANTPADVLETLTGILSEITASEEYQEFCTMNNLMYEALTPDQMLERIKAEASVNQALLAGT